MRLKVSGSRWEGRWEKRGRTRGSRNHNQDKLCEKMAMFNNKEKNKRNCTLKMASTTVTLWVTAWVDFDICIKGISYQIQLEKATSNFGHNIESNWRTERNGQIHFLNRNGGQNGNVLLLFWWISMCIVVGTVTQERTLRLLPKETWEVEQVNTRC